MERVGILVEVIYRQLYIKKNYIMNKKDLEKRINDIIIYFNINNSIENRKHVDTLIELRNEVRKK